MELLTTLLENDSVKNFLQENEEVIVAGAGMFSEFPQIVKDYISSHLNEFVEGTVDETFENMVVFAEAAANQFLDELTDMMLEA